MDAHFLDGSGKFEQELANEIHRLLGLERAVVVEDGDACGGRDEIGRTLLGHFLDEGDDGLLRCGVVPGWKRVGAGDGGGEGHRASKRDREQVSCFHWFGLVAWKIVLLRW